MCELQDVIIGVCVCIDGMVRIFLCVVGRQVQLCDRVDVCTCVYAC